jgi:hypothetical protein
MKTISIFKTIVVALGFITLMGCAKELESIRPRDQIAQDQLSADDLGKVINGIYAAVEEFTYNYYFDGDIKGENFEAGPSFALSDPMLMTASESNILSLWRSAFTTLKQVNFLVETYESSSNQADATVKIAGGTGYYFRALIYYNMAIRWGGVPILRKRTNDVVPISPEADVWNVILEDLGKAEALLPAFSDKYYVSQSASDALFAKAYLSLGNATQAATYADKVIAKSSFALATTSTEYAEAFICNSPSKEIVFALVNARSSSLLLLYQLVNDVDPTWNYAPAAVCHAGLYADAAAKSGDLRASAVFGTDNQRTLKWANGQAGQGIPNSKPSQSPLVVTRLAEMYLIKAEAQGNTTDGKQTLKTFMEKRYATLNLPATMSDADFQNMVLDERHRELYGEGFRWYDLKRTNRLDLFRSLNGRSYLMRFPVPQNEIDLAGKSNYPQNEGY